MVWWLANLDVRSWWLRPPIDQRTERQTACSFVGVSSLLESMIEIYCIFDSPMEVFALLKMFHGICMKFFNDSCHLGILNHFDTVGRFLMKRSYALVVSTEWFRQDATAIGCYPVDVTSAQVDLPDAEGRLDILKVHLRLRQAEFRNWKYHVMVGEVTVHGWWYLNIFDWFWLSMVGDTDFEWICRGTSLCRSHWKISQRDSCQVVNQAWTSYHCLPADSIHCMTCTECTLTISKFSKDIRFDQSEVWWIPWCCFGSYGEWGHVEKLVNTSCFWESDRNTATQLLGCFFSGSDSSCTTQFLHSRNPSSDTCSPHSPCVGNPSGWPWWLRRGGVGFHAVSRINQASSYKL